MPAKKSHDPRESSSHPDLLDYRRKEKKTMENSCVTGSEALEEKDISPWRRNRTLYLLSQLMFYLGIFILIYLVIRSL